MTRVYERPFEVALMDADAVPAEKEMSASLGGHLDGCRIGFDLGASDYKVSAVKDGEVVYTDEFPWNPEGSGGPRAIITTHLNERPEKSRRASAARGRHRRQFRGCDRRQPNQGRVAVSRRARRAF